MLKLKCNFPDVDEGPGHVQVTGKAMIPVPESNSDTGGGRTAVVVGDSEV
jgi:hypothetical protein